MKFGFVISLWLIMYPIFAQNCEEIGIGPVRYYEGIGDEKTEISSYFVPCFQTPTLTFSLPSTIDDDFIDPFPSTRAGIILVLFLEKPGQSLLTVREFSDLLYRDEFGQPKFFTDPQEAIEVSELLNIGNIYNQFILVPVLVTNLEGDDPDAWFEDDCVRVYPDKGLTMIEKPEVYEFIHFDEISFTLWPEEVPMTDYFDLTFTDRETGEGIPFSPSNNRSFKLKFPKAEGVFGLQMNWKQNPECNIVEIGKNWSFPTVAIVMDTVMGFRHSQRCVPVRTFDFESVTSFEFSLIWGNDALDFTAIKSIHPALEPYLKIGDIRSSGNTSKIIIELPPQSESITLPDSAVLFEWCGKPLAGPGQYVEMDFSVEGQDPVSGFDIQGLETNHRTAPGGIIVQEDRELIYDLIQLCNTRDGRHRVEVDIINDEAYPYSYSFHSPAVADSTIRSIPFIIPDVPPGQYEFTIRDSFGFEITETVVVRERVPPNFELNVDSSLVIHPTCLNPFGGEIGITITPEDQTYSLNLLNDDAMFSDQRASGLVAGTYIIEAENQSGCIDTIHFRLPNPRKIDVAWPTESLVLCPGESDVILEIENKSFPPDASIEYQLGGGEPMKVGEPYAITDPGNYPLQFWNDDGCTLDTNVVVHDSPDEMVIWDTTAVVVLLGDTLAFSSSDPEGLTWINWEFEGQRTGNETEFRYVPDQSGTLTYTATVFDRCTYRDSLWVEVINPDPGSVEYNFPNAFSPNGDGINDVYTITPIRQIDQVRRMEVFDRYGNYIFEKEFSKDDPEIPGWDGRYAGVDVAPGVYAVQVELLLFDGREETISFDVMLLR